MKFQGVVYSMSLPNTENNYIGSCIEKPCHGVKSPEAILNQRMNSHKHDSTMIERHKSKLYRLIREVGFHKVVS